MHNLNNKVKELFFYEPPFHIASAGTWVYDGNNNFVFQFLRKYDLHGEYVPQAMELETLVLRSLNSKTHMPIPELNLSFENGMIFNNGEGFILIRGWGNLTGIGGHNFPVEKAEKTQDDFRDWMIYKLSL